MLIACRRFILRYIVVARYATRCQSAFLRHDICFLCLHDVCYVCMVPSCRRHNHAYERCLLRRHYACRDGALFYGVYYVIR